MAPRTPQVPLRRRPGAVPLKVLAENVLNPYVPVEPPATSKRPKTSAFPLLPATAAAFLLLGAAQLLFWWWEARIPDLSGPTSAPKSNPFVALKEHEAEAMPTPAEDTGKVREAQRLVAAPLDQNLQFGDAMPHVTVTIFTDPSCGICRAKVQRWTANLPVGGVKQVYKFWPQNPARLTPGMLVELARRENKTAAFWHSLQNAGIADLDDAKLLTMLDSAGLPLSEQRTALVNNSTELMSMLEPDIALAKNAQLPPPPVIVVDDYVLDGEVLSPASLSSYVKKRLEGRELLDKNDLWLMKK